MEKNVENVEVVSNNFYSFAYATFGLGISMALNLMDVHYELIQQLVVIVVQMKFNNYKQHLLLNNKRLRSYLHIDSAC